MVVWTGALLRLRDEAELAAVLGHEFGHFEMRHGLKTFRRARTIGDIIILDQRPLTLQHPAGQPGPTALLL